METPPLLSLPDWDEYLRLIAGVSGPVGISGVPGTRDEGEGYARQVSGDVLKALFKLKLAYRLSRKIAKKMCVFGRKMNELHIRRKQSRISTPDDQ